MVLSPLEQHGPAAGGGADPDPGTPAEQRVSTEVTRGWASRCRHGDEGSQGRSLTGQERDVRSRWQMGLERAFKITGVCVQSADPLCCVSPVAEKGAYRHSSHLPSALSGSTGDHLCLRIKTCDPIAELDSRAETRYPEVYLQLISVLSP